eukprot:1158689-Pelagomonas_calceolata.AAC.18
MAISSSACAHGGLGYVLQACTVKHQCEEGVCCAIFLSGSHSVAYKVKQKKSEKSEGRPSSEKQQTASWLQDAPHLFVRSPWVPTGSKPLTSMGHQCGPLSFAPAKSYLVVLHPMHLSCQPSILAHTPDMSLAHQRLPRLCPSMPPLHPCFTPPAVRDLGKHNALDQTRTRLSETVHLQSPNP